MSNSAERAELIRLIVQSQKFLGMWPLLPWRRRARLAELNDYGTETLQILETWFGTQARMCANPLMARVLKAALKGEMDPRWEPFVWGMKTLAREGTKDQELSKSFECLVDHATCSKILLNLASTVTELLRRTLSSGISFQSFHTESTLDSLVKFFEQAGFRELLERAPMEYTWGEADAVCLLLQWARAPADSISIERAHDGALWYMKLGKDDKREVIPYSNAARSALGYAEDFESMTLIGYARRFTDILLKIDQSP